MSPTRHFCCCLPVRFGVFVLSIGSIIGSGAYAATIWYAIYSESNSFGLYRSGKLTWV